MHRRHIDALCERAGDLHEQLVLLAAEPGAAGTAGAQIAAAAAHVDAAAEILNAVYVALPAEPRRARPMPTTPRLPPASRCE